MIILSEPLISETDYIINTSYFDELLILIVAFLDKTVQFL